MSYDLLSASLDELESVNRLVNPTSSREPLWVNGVMKVAQRWLMEFYTEKESMPLLPTRGCSFMTELRNGHLRTEADVFQRFLIAQGEIESNLLDDEEETDSDDEIYQSAVLSELVIDQHKLTLYVTLTTRAGTAVTLTAPVSLSF